MEKLEREIRSAIKLIYETGDKAGEWLALKVIPTLNRKDREMIKKIRKKFDKLKPALPIIEEFLEFLKKD